MESPLRWPGGKSILAPRIVATIPAHRCYCEPFCGGAWVFFTKPRDMSRCEVLNDLDGELVNLYRMLQTRGASVLRRAGRLPYSRALYYRLWRSRPGGALDRAGRYLYINRVGFGGRIVNRSFGTAADRRRYVLPGWLRDDPRAMIRRLTGVIFENLDFAAAIRLYDRTDTFFYVDPPYLGTVGLYPGRFGLDEHRRLAGVLGTVRGKWLLSSSDRPEIRDLYRRWRILPMPTRYTMNDRGVKQVTELLIGNFPFVDHAGRPLARPPTSRFRSPVNGRLRRMPRPPRDGRRRRRDR